MGGLEEVWGLVGGVWGTGCVCGWDVMLLCHPPPHPNHNATSWHVHMAEVLPVPTEPADVEMPPATCHCLMGGPDFGCGAVWWAVWLWVFCATTTPFKPHYCLSNPLHCHSAEDADMSSASCQCLMVFGGPK